MARPDESAPKRRHPLPRRLPWLVLLLMLVSGHAAGEKWEVEDTHQRLDRIYEELGIEQPEAAPQESGCQPPERRRIEERPRPRAAPAAVPPFLGYLLIGIVLAAMLVPLFLMLRNSYREARSAEEPIEEEPEEADTIAGERQVWRVDVGEARRLFQEGRIPEAYAALHRVTLLTLDGAGLIRLDETTTNWEYVRKLSARPEMRQVLAAVTEAAERSVLGRRPPDAARYQQLEGLVVERVQGVTA